jgi:hypothetical protein
MREIVIVPAGRLANRMIQRIAAETISKSNKEASVCHPGFPEWQISKTTSFETKRRTVLIKNKFGLVENISGNPDRYVSQRKKDLILTGNFLNTNILSPSIEFARSYFSNQVNCNCCPAVSNNIQKNFNIVHLRLGDIWNAGSKTSISYFPLSLEYYKQIFEASGRPFAIIMKCDSEDQYKYAEEISKIANGSIILPEGCVIRDFQTMRYASTLSLATSTFSWLASWLSESINEVFIPNAGLFSNSARPDINLINYTQKISVNMLQARPFMIGDNE